MVGAPPCPVRQTLPGPTDSVGNAHVVPTLGSPSMTTVFSRIIAGELPARFVWSDEHAVAFLSVNPVGAGPHPRRVRGSRSTSGPTRRHR